MKMGEKWWWLWRKKKGQEQILFSPPSIQTNWDGHKERKRKVKDQNLNTVFLNKETHIDITK